MLNFAEPTTDLAKSIAARAEGRTGGIKQLQEGRIDLYQINPFLIHVEEGFNVRDFESERMVARIDELALSIMESGLKRPLKVRTKNKMTYLVDGECRLRAIHRAINVYGAEIRLITVQMADRNMSDAQATLSIAIENDTLELTNLERGAVFKRLENYGWSIADIAKSVGKTAPHVTSLIELHSVPDSLKALIRKGDIAPTLALTIARDSDFDEATILSKIGAAKEVVAAKGRTRVTAKSVQTERTTLRDKVAAIIAASEIVEDSDGDDDTLVLITLTSEQAANLGKLLKMPIAAPVAEEAVA